MQENESELVYHTRDAKGKEMIKRVGIKTYPTERKDFTCQICGRNQTEGTDIHKIVSSNFTDWGYVGESVCPSCSRYFSLYFYNYIINDGVIHLYNVREMAEAIKQPQKPPFLAVITKSQKKHLFYKSVLNQDPENFVVNLEEEQIKVNRKELNKLFTYVESMLALGESKARLSGGEISYQTMAKIGYRAYRFLEEKRKEREIMIPLHLAQKPEYGEEEALCNLDLILNQ